MGGMFYAREDENGIVKPQFTPEGTSQDNGLELLTDEARGLKVRIDNNPTTLYPNEYLVMGEIQGPVEILNLTPSGIPNRVDVYEGEFSIPLESVDYWGNPRYYVKFPATLKWSGRVMYEYSNFYWDFFGEAELGEPASLYILPLPEGYGLVEPPVYRFKIVNGLADIDAYGQNYNQPS